MAFPLISSIGRRVEAATLGFAIVSGMATLPGCGDSSAGHMADPQAAAKTLVGDDPTLPPTKKTSNKRLQKRIEEEQQEVAKHPKIR